MKKYSYIFTLIIIVVFKLTSCSDDFLNTSPYDQIASNNMWNSESKVDQGVAGVYSALRYSMIAESYRYLDGLGFVNTFYGNSSSNPYVLDFLRGTITPGGILFTNTWKQHYEGIHRANDAIDNLHEAPLSEEKKERLLCEVKFLRAYFYYRLNAFFKGVPIYDQPTQADEMNKAQSSTEDVYKFCIQDLTDCINSPYFPDNTLSENYGRASKGAAYALRGMIYMWTNEFDKAIQDLSMVESCGYGLWKEEWSLMFKYENERNKEMVLPLQYDEAAGFTSDIQKYIGGRSHYDGWTEAQPNADFVDSFLNSDGSEFTWGDYLPDWNSMSVAQREVFFLRDGLSSASSDPKIASAYNSAYDRIGASAMAKYLPYGNEDRIKAAYASRDPRLLKTVFTPYSSEICYNPYWNSAEEHELTLRWPLIDNIAPYWDMWSDKRSTAFYMYKKYNETRKGRYINRDRCHVDLPLIRFTDVVLLLAEAYNENDRLDESIQIFNKVRTRTGVEMPPLTNGGTGPNAVLSKEDMRKRIQYERRVELALEGINLFDELRWGTWKESKFNNGSSPGRKSWWGRIETTYNWKGDYQTTWPVPNAEVQMNENLIPTEGWSY